MTVFSEVYKCEICGNIIQVMDAGPGELVCCGQPMVKMEEKASDQGMEKHVPVIEKTDAGYKVKCGEVPHPMEDAHYIQWLELVADGVSYHKFLKPGAPAEAEFCIEAGSVAARAYCNLHGLWKGQ